MKATQKLIGQQEGCTNASYFRATALGSVRGKIGTNGMISAGNKTLAQAGSRQPVVLVVNEHDVMVIDAATKAVRLRAPQSDKRGRPWSRA